MGVLLLRIPKPRLFWSLFWGKWCIMNRDRKEIIGMRGREGVRASGREGRRRNLTTRCIMRLLNLI